MKRSEAGFAHLVMVLVAVVAIGVIGFVGYRVMQSQNDKKDTTTTSVSKATQTKIDAAPTLKAVNTTLTDVASQLNSSLDTSTLDSDIQALY